MECRPDAPRHCLRECAQLCAASLVLGAGALAQAIARVSVSNSGTQGNGESYIHALSADGRFVAFQSLASNLVPGDSNASWDVFVRDLQAGTTERVSVDSAGVQGNSFSWSPSISADGRFVAFSAGASNLVPGDTNGKRDVFVRDRLLGTTERVSLSSAGLEGSGDSENASISADGRFVAFYSEAPDLIPTNTNGCGDIFLRDRLLSTTELISVDPTGALADGQSWLPTISDDGRFVAFVSIATNLVALDTNYATDIFVRDRVNGTTVRASVDSAGLQANSNSHAAWISGNGQCVAFASYASNLVAGDTNLCEDIFVRDLIAGTTERISVDSAGLQANADSWVAAISADGAAVAFYGYASNLVPGDSNGCADVFLRDRPSAMTRRLSVSANGQQGNDISWYPSISADGRLLTFASSASNLVPGDTNGSGDVFVLGDLPPPVPFCAGDGSLAACPCANSGVSGHGCENSASSGGAWLGAQGAARLQSDDLVLSSSGELPSVLSILLEGTAALGPLHLGDGLRCTGGLLHRLFVHYASAGVFSAPQSGEPSISARSAALGDVLTSGATRYYQVYYRDPIEGFCPAPQGAALNISNGLAILWTP